MTTILVGISKMYEIKETSDKCLTESQNYNSNSRKRKKASDESYSEDNLSDTMENCIKRETDTEEDAGFKSTYGLKREYLKALGITPPIEKWVHVTNFRCDKSELKDVLELAGHVVICAVITIRVRTAKVMYNHPLEAVQAVSMLNGQMFYGQKLQVTMMRCPPDSIILPKGLKDVGPGLGENGKPLRDIVKHFKKFTKNEDTKIDVNLFCFDDITDLSALSDNIVVKNEENEFKSQISPILLADNNSQESADKYKGNIQDRPFKVTNVVDLDDNTCVSRNKTDSVDKVAKIDGLKEMEEKKSTNQWNRTDIESPPCDELEKDSRFRSRMQLRVTNVALPVITNTMPQEIKQPPLQPFSNVPLGTTVSQPRHMAPLRPTIGPPGVDIRPSGPPTGTFGPPLSSGGPFRPNFPGPIGPPQMARLPNTNMALGQMRPTGPAGPVSALDSFVLQFSNLPPTTTFPLLCEKVSQCGQVLSLQLTTPGCAIAKFAHKAHAERCFQVFNGKCVDGCIIKACFT